MSIPAASLNNFPSLSRRLSRIFSHAYFHHREAFLTFEAVSSLYARFMALCETYGLVGSSLLVIPREELGLTGGEQDEEEDEEGVQEEDEDQEGEDEVDEQEGAHDSIDDHPASDRTAGGRNASVSPVKLALNRGSDTGANGTGNEQRASTDDQRKTPRAQGLAIRTFAAGTASPPSGRRPVHSQL
jgi:hypothetical protein